VPPGSGWSTVIVRIETSEGGLAGQTLESLPTQPGVYVFRDATGQVLFIGTAESLREGVAAHFAPQEDGEPSEEPWTGRSVSVEQTAVDCDLDAVLLAAARQAELRPAYGPRGGRLICPVIRFEGGAFLRAEPTNALDGRALHFGPYGSPAAARHTVQTVRRVFQIRSCSRRLPARRPAMRIPCERLAQQLCPAPCADLVTPVQYGVQVDFALRFVLSGKRATLEAVQARLDELSTGGQAGSWEHLLLSECQIRLRRVRKEYHPLPGGPGAGGLVMTYRTADGRLAVFYVHEGRPLARFRVSAEEAAGPGLGALVEAQLSAQGARPELSLEETNALLRWIYQQAGRPELTPVVDESAPAAVAAAIAGAVRRHFQAAGPGPLTGTP
jgi:hypothetical protein